MATGDGAVELCSAFREEQQFLWYGLRTVDAWTAQPRGRQHLPGGGRRRDHLQRGGHQQRRRYCSGRPRSADDLRSTKTGATIRLGGKSIRDLLNANVSWGAVMDGFDLTVTNPNSLAKVGDIT
jgi:hypothetical protein